MRIQVAGVLVLLALAAWFAMHRGEEEPPVPAAEAVNETADAADRSPSPLETALDLARGALKMLETVDDYKCTFVKRERVDGKLLDQQKLAMKVRHKPFSVQMRFIEPADMAGQEAIYVEGKNDGNLMGHATGLAGKLGWISLNPQGFLAMRDNRYAITDAGMKNLVKKLIDLGEKPGLLDGCSVAFDEEATVDERPCTRVEISMPRPKKKPKRKNKTDFTLAIARIFLDHEHNVPVRFETYEWPDDVEAKPRVVEQYTYQKIEFNVGLIDFDFDPANPEYKAP
jgi:hypothetical protein